MLSTVQFNHNDTALLWMAGSAKAEWFRSHRWPNTKTPKLASYNLTPDEEQHYMQFIGLAGEAAIHRILYGDLHRFWIAQGLQQKSHRGDGGNDLPGLDIKCADMIGGKVPNLLIQAKLIKPETIYILAIASVDEPKKPELLEVKVLGCIRGSSARVHGSIVEFHYLNYLVSAEQLTPIDVLKWPELAGDQQLQFADCSPHAQDGV